MPMGVGGQTIGASLLGMLQGMQAAKQQDMELEHKKSLLKLEQDKLKLMEKETELTGQSKLYQAMSEYERAKAPIPLGADQGLYSREGQEIVAPKGKLKDRFMEVSPGAGLFDLSGAEKPQMVGSRPPAGGGAEVPKEIQIAERIAKERGIKVSDALFMILKQDKKSFVARYVEAIAKTQLPGAMAKSVSQLRLEGEKLWDELDGKTSKTDKFFNDAGLPSEVEGLMLELEAGS